MNRNAMDALEKHFKQWKQISDRLQGQLEPVLKAQRAIKKAIRPTLELQKALKSPLEPFLEEQRRLEKKFESIKLPNYNLPDLSPFTKQIQQYQKSLRGIISPAFEELQRSFKELPPKPRTAKYVEQIAADTYKAALLSPLAESTPIGASEHEREEGFNLLNRHTVLHGEFLDYGNKVNSLKAISLINYVSQALKTDVNYP
ncbi:hypothetical protein [Francisella sp. 19X1-34]|uniref:hypothetical protein n=1 Tax=Francisella sp. 19X1-34 TaxID=3087177 RepID=UPI002E2FE481|nr:hypothetical protein [Francisella sp. 19X1-34]MED7789604.1 hypothetical protein [Francisella sp. 19X1-34]